MLLMETAGQTKENTRRIDKLESDTEALKEIAYSVKALAQNMETMTKEQEKQGKRLEALEKQPAERWNSIIKTILTTIASTLTGGIIGALVALLF